MAKTADIDSMEPTASRPSGRRRVVPLRQRDTVTAVRPRVGASARRRRRQPRDLEQFVRTRDRGVQRHLHQDGEGHRPVVTIYRSGRLIDDYRSSSTRTTPRDNVKDAEGPHARKVRDAMTGDVLTMTPGRSLRDAAKFMADHNVGAVVIMDPEQPGPGIITERDLVRSLGKGEDPDSEHISEHLTSHAAFADIDWDLDEAAETMAKRGFRHLVVVQGGELCGIISMRDIMRVWRPSASRPVRLTEAVGCARSPTPGGCAAAWWSARRRALLGRGRGRGRRLARGPGLAPASSVLAARDGRVALAAQARLRVRLSTPGTLPLEAATPDEDAARLLGRGAGGGPRRRGRGARVRVPRRATRTTRRRPTRRTRSHVAAALRTLVDGPPAGRALGGGRPEQPWAYVWPDRR